MTTMTVPQAARGQESRTHSVKCWPYQYNLILTGLKTFDLRWNDRDYRTGDVLHLHEYDPERRHADPERIEQGEERGCFTGRDCQLLITHVMQGGVFGLQGGYVALSLRDTTPLAADPADLVKVTGND